MDNVAQIQLADWQTTILVILLVCGAISVIANAVTAIRTWRKPGNDQQKMVLDHEQRISKIEIVSKERDNQLAIILRSQMAVLNHLITGDGKDALTDSQKEIQDYLIRR